MHKTRKSIQSGEKYKAISKIGREVYSSSHQNPQLRIDSLKHIANLKKNSHYKSTVYSDIVSKK